VVPLERLAVHGETLYFGRPVEANEHFRYHERWLIPEQGWAISRFTFHEHFKDRVDWYIEMDLIQRDGPMWRVCDGYLDVAVIEGERYEVWDAEELAEGLKCGEISQEDAIAALEALGRLHAALRRLKHSGAALLAEFAPGLPR
jgi:predicted RNA-binding protein associated with RNAse of E/G family